MSRLQHEHLEVALAAEERDSGREVQVLLAEALDLEALGHDDVFAVGRIVVDRVSLAARGVVGPRLGLSGGGEERRDRKERDEDEQRRSHCVIH